MDLKRWLPFKFSRKRQDAEGTRREAASGSALPTSLLRSDPMRLMHDMLREPFVGFGHLDRWFGDHSPLSFQPQADVVDDGKAIRVSVELPGLDKDDVDVSIEDGTLSLSGEKRIESSEEKDGCYHTERAYGSFHRLIPLPTDVDLDRVEARFKKGVLTVTVPKAPGAEPSGRRVAIQ